MLLGIAILVVEINAFSSAKRFTLSEALGHIINHAFNILWSAILIIGGGTLFRRARNGADVRPRPRTNAQPGNLTMILVFCAVLYGVYAPLHIYVSMNDGCNLHASLMTMIPVRQLYFIPRIEREWNINSIQSMTESDSSLAGMLGTALASKFKEPIMEVVRHGGCADILRMTGGGTELQSRKAQRRAANSPTSFNTSSRDWTNTTPPPSVVTASANRDTPTATLTPEPTSSIEESCFPYDTAYVTGNMNIRELATTNSPVVNTTDPMDIFEVSESQQGDSWCWLRVSKGWMALTRYVTHDISAVLPSIDDDGDIRFKNKVAKAFELMGQKTSRWFQYTVQIIDSVVLADLPGDSLAQVWNDGTNRVKVDLKGMLKDTAYFASILVHEACHLYQHKDASRQRSMLGWEEEKECYRIQASALRQIFPGHSMIKTLRCASENYPATFC